MTLVISEVRARHAQKGVGKAAEYLRKETEGYRSDIPSQIVDWREELEREIDEIRAECQEVGWDGYEAEPITSEAAAGAKEFLRELPEGIEPPEIVPESRGSIAFEWDRGRDMLLSISVEGDDLVYAGILGPGNSRSGEALLSLGMPFEIEHALSMHFAKDRSDSEQD